jgi:HD-GYP domain-containing protein (c-di-GMP phosphodiesterase class II)
LETQRIALRGLGADLKARVWEAERLLRIGRLEKLEVVLNDGSVSRQHAEVVWGEQGWVVRDLGSANGTYRNGERVGRGDSPLRRGDILQCGNVQLVVQALGGGPWGGEETPGYQVEVHAAVSQTREQALARGAAVAGAGLTRLMDVGRDFRHTPSLDAFLEWTLFQAAEALDAQSGFIVLQDERTDHPALRAAFDQDRPGSRRVWFSRSLTQRILERGESLLCHIALDGAGEGADGGGPTRRSVLGVLLRSLHRRLGVLYLERGFDREPFTEDNLSLADALAVSISSTIDSLGHVLDKERNLLLQTLTALVQMVELRDDYTGTHTQRVTDYALLLAEELRLPPEECAHLRCGTPLHDLGKVGIGDHLLQKPGPLTPAEMEGMKTHTVKGSSLLESIPGLADLLPIVRSHHERWDGTGYPDGLSGERIPRLARVVAIADAFDAMTSDRPYRAALPADVAFAEIERRSGTQFDPAYARAFLRLRPRIEELLEQRDHLDQTSTRSELARLIEGLNLPGRAAVPGREQPSPAAEV